MIKFYVNEYTDIQDAKFQTWANNLNYVRDTVLPQLRSYNEDEITLKRLSKDLKLSFRTLIKIANKYSKYVTVRKTKNGGDIFISIHKDLR